MQFKKKSNYQVRCCWIGQIFRFLGSVHAEPDTEYLLGASRQPGNSAQHLHLDHLWLEEFPTQMLSLYNINVDGLIIFKQIEGLFLYSVNMAFI